MERADAWPARLTWVAWGLLLAPALGQALDRRDVSRPVELTVEVGLWTAWAVVLLATLVPSTVSLTVLRIASPAAVAAAVAILVAADGTAWSVAGLTAALVAALAAFSQLTSQVFVDGSSYGDETRMPLRVPTALLAGPIELVWLVTVAGAVTGPLLLAARQWLAGAVVVAVGFPVAWWGGRVLHRLSRRWLVFVPAGVVIHDRLALAYPVLVRRSSLAAFGLAFADSRALDLTRGAAGLAVELRTRDALAWPVVVGRGRSESVGDDRVLVTPTRPGAVLAEARRRRLA